MKAVYLVKYENTIDKRNEGNTGNGNLYSKGNYFIIA